MKSGITSVSTSVLCILAALLGDGAAARLDLPRGFTASLYARGITGARDLDLRPDGTLTLRGVGDERFEILPATAEEPVTVLRVAAELDASAAPTPATLAVRAPRFVQMRWNSGSGELRYSLVARAGTGLSVSPQMVALARRLARRDEADVALAPDGSLFVADARAGAVWRVRRTTL